MVAAGGVAALVTGMQAHVGNSALASIADFAAGADAVMAAGCVAAVVAGMRAHVGVAKVQEWGIITLRNIAYAFHAGAGTVVAMGGVVTIVAGMQAHVGVAEVQERGRYALKHIVCNSAAGMDAVYSSGGGGRNGCNFSGQQSRQRLVGRHRQRQRRR